MNVVWTDKKRWGFLGLPLTFTRYTLTEEKLLVDSGFLSKKQEEVRLYRIMDMTLNRSFGQRIFGLGTIVCNTADKTSPTLELKNIKKPKDIKEKLSDMVESERERKRVSSREYMTHDYDGDGDYDDDDDNHHFF